MDTSEQAAPAPILPSAESDLPAGIATQSQDSENARSQGDRVARGEEDEFEEGDPRRGPFTPEELAESARYIRDPLRWHRYTRVDWLAVELQHGRGLTIEELAEMFDIGDSTIRKRAKVRNWWTPMDLCDRRELSRLVWLAGLSRIAPDDMASRESLKAMSEWRMRAAEPSYRWKRKGAGQQTINVNGIADDNRNAAGDGEEHVDVDELRQQLDALLAEIDGDDAIGRGEPAVDAGAGAEGAGPDDGAAEAGTGRLDQQVVAAVGAAGAAAA